MTEQTFSGSCLCGAVSVTAKPEHLSMGACHCGMCRKWGGGPMLAVECGDHVAWQGEDSIGVYDSSEWAQRGFCKQCGTHLFYRLKDVAFYALPVGLLSGSEVLPLTQEVCIDRKPGNYSFAGDQEKITEAALFAKFGA